MAPETTTTTADGPDNRPAGGADDPIYVVDALIADDIDAYLEQHEHKTMLRFITCGSVDDGKSTLIGRLLYDSKMIFEDQLEALQADSKKVGHAGPGDRFRTARRWARGRARAGHHHRCRLSLLRHRKAQVHRRRHAWPRTIHPQHGDRRVDRRSRGDPDRCAQGRAGADTAHSYLCHLIGIRNIVLAINKMDLVDYSQESYDAILAEYTEFANSIGIEQFVAMPISGFKGDNITALSDNTPWYTGPTLVEHLETVEVDASLDQAKPFRMPVQWVNRPNLDFRGFSGLVATGSIAPGTTVRVLPSGKTSTLTRVVTLDGDLDNAVAGQSVTLTFADEIDCSRGDVIAAADSPPQTADQFEATLVWMNDAPLHVGRAYWLKLGTQIVSASVQEPKYTINVNTMEHLAAKTLELNAIGVAELSTDKPIVFEAYVDNRTLGGFILIDKMTNATVAAGMINFSLRRAQNVHWQALDIGRRQRADLKNQKPAVLWFTGLSGSGKSTIANLVEKQLFRMNRHTFLLDGDNIRHGLNKDLGFTEADRIENIRRVGEVARLMSDSGLIVITAFISPFRAERDMVRSMLPDGEFFEVFIDTPLGLPKSGTSRGSTRRPVRGNSRTSRGSTVLTRLPRHRRSALTRQPSTQRRPRRLSLTTCSATSENTYVAVPRA